MSHLVSDRKHVVNCLLIVQKHERMHAVHAPRICAASLASVFVDVNPTALECVCQNLRILFARHFQRLFDEFDCVVIFERKFLLVDDRSVQIVHIEGFHAKHFLSERNVSVKGFRTFADRFEKFVIASGRHVFVVHRIVERTLESSHFCVEPILFDVAGIVCRNGVDVILVSCKHAVESVFTHSLVGTLQEHAVHAVAHLNLFSVFVLDGRKLHVRIVEHRKHFPCVVREKPHFAEQFFLFLG